MLVSSKTSLSTGSLSLQAWAGAEESLAQAVCGRQWAEEELEGKACGMRGDLSQKEGCIRATQEGITTTGVIMQLFRYKIGRGS